jgi:hypothetical protein
MTRAPRPKAFALPLIVCMAMSAAHSACSSKAGDETKPSSGSDTDANLGGDVAEESEPCLSPSGCDSGSSVPTDASPQHEASYADAGLPPEDCAGLTYCDDFETYDAAPLKRGQKLGPWSVGGGTNATIMVDTVRAYTGKQSFHVRFPPSQSGGILTQAAAPEAGLIAGNNLFGRSMFYFVVDPGASDAGLEPDGGVGLPIKVHSELFFSSGTTSTADGGTGSDIAVTGQALYLNYYPPGTFERAVGTGVIAGNAWHCLQWELDGSGDASTNQAQVWLDGKQVVSVTKTNLWVAATPWQTFSVGFWTEQPEVNSIDVSVDTVALSDKMLPCP